MKRREVMQMLAAVAAEMVLPARRAKAPPPRDPIAAVTHPDPYPYYAELVASTPMYRDPSLNLWVASSAAAVTAALTSDFLRVRPAPEPVPTGIAGTPAGAVFGHLVRMTDGPAHGPLRRNVVMALSAFDPVTIAHTADRWAWALAADARVDVNAFALQLPAYTMASLLGVPRDRLAEVTDWVHDLTRTFAGAEDAARGGVAAEQLSDLMRGLPVTQQIGVENTVGLVTQAYDATAGLIGTVLLAVGRHPEARADLGAVVEETLRYDAPVQNTRRFAERDGIVAGQPVRAGDTILVVVAAANRDPAANPDPARFDVHRTDRRVFTFGAGAHACPGAVLARTIARSGVGRLLDVGVDPRRLAAPVTYRPSVNTRVPVFG
jgi:cytochrome P450